MVVALSRPGMLIHTVWSFAGVSIEATELTSTLSRRPPPRVGTRTVRGDPRLLEPGWWAAAAVHCGIAWHDRQFGYYAAGTG
jgi:hypothetical protein